MESDPHSSIIIFRSEIDKIYALCNKLIDFNSSLTEDHEFSLNDALDYLNSFFNIKIHLPYLRFLEDIVCNSFGVVFQKSSTSNEFLDFF